MPRGADRRMQTSPPKIDDPQQLRKYMTSDRRSKRGISAYVGSPTPRKPYRMVSIMASIVVETRSIFSGEFRQAIV